jgi:nicotinamide-nucleotide amidase
MNCEILAVGSELLTPYRQDTNSLYLTERMNALGVEVTGKAIVGDNLKLAADAIQHSLRRADIVLMTGGLGPTMDDVTRESVAAALGVEVFRDPDILTALYKRFAERRIPMPENNARQADIVRGAVSLMNPTGTAPGQWIDTVFQKHRKIIILLPGVPHEMKTIFTEHCEPRLRELVPVRAIASRMLRIAMMPESEVDARTAPIYGRFHDVETTILAAVSEIQLHFRCTASIQHLAQKRVDELCGLIEDELGESVFSSHGETLEQVVLFFLEMQGETLATAESCTGGLVAQRLTSVPGSSRSFFGGAVTYTSEMKTEFAEVPTTLLHDYGPVSREVAAAMAEGIRERSGATLGLSVTGVAGPGGASPETPVGQIFVALADGKETEVKERRFSGDRERVRFQASSMALDLVRRRLMQVR